MQGNTRGALSAHPLSWTVSLRDPTKTFIFSVDKDLGSLEFLKGVWAQKVMLYFREKFRRGA